MEDTEWVFFEQFIIAIRGRGGRRARNHRLVLDGIFWIARTGAQWRDLPEEFGKWGSVYRQFRRWTLAVLWDLVPETLNQSEVVPDQVQMIDSTIIQKKDRIGTSRNTMVFAVTANAALKFKSL